MSPKILNKEDLKKREQELIETALEIIKTAGTAGLTMDKVVARVPYSKGTVYNHFISKEDLLTGICNSSMSELAGLFQRAVKFKGTTRERIVAINFAYLLHAQRHPDRFMLVVSAKTANLMERTSEKRIEEHRGLEKKLLGSMAELVVEAIAVGDLLIPSYMDVKQVVFAMWSSTFGAIALLISGVEECCSGRAGLDMEREAVNNGNLLLDGLRWLPLTNGFDYDETRQRIAEEIFSDELTQLRMQNPEEPNDN